MLARCYLFHICSKVSEAKSLKSYLFKHLNRLYSYCCTKYGQFWSFLLKKKPYFWSYLFQNQTAKVLNWCHFVFFSFSSAMSGLHRVCIIHFCIERTLNCQADNLQVLTATNREINEHGRFIFPLFVLKFDAHCRKPALGELKWLELGIF